MGEDDVVVDVDVDDGNGNDEMSTNRTPWKRRQSDIERAGERNVVHTCIQTQCQYQSNLYRCICTKYMFIYSYAVCLSSGWIMLRLNVMLLLSLSLLLLPLFCHGNWFDCVT